MNERDNKLAKINPLLTTDQKFKEVYEMYFDKLFSYAYQATGSYDMAKDIVSDVFYNLLQSNRDLNGIQNIQSYLYKSVKNQAIKAISIESLSFEGKFHAEQMEYIENINPQDLMIGRELEAFLETMIDNLPPHCQLAFRMIREKGLNYEEAAKELDVAPKTVKNQFFLALSKIRSGLAEHFKDTPVIRMISNQNYLLIITSLLNYF